MLLRYVKIQAMVLLCGGLVGPIFLAVYFAVGADPLLKWMFWSGLLVTAADVLLALALTGYGAKASAAAHYLEGNGVLASAQITAMTETGTRINDRPLIKLGLHIEGPGLAPFDAEDRVLASVPRLPLITGRRLVAMVDPATNAFRIDWDRSALLAGALPAKFTLAEDNRTYDLTGQAGPLLEIMRILQANGIPLQGTIDVRSNPAVRRQVAEVVRDAAHPPAADAALSAPKPSFAQRIQELERLRADGVLSEAEYTAKRQQIIAEL